MEFAGRRYELVDLPGLYSLAPRSRDEMVAVDLLLGRQKDYPAVDAIICIVDAANLAQESLSGHPRCWNWAGLRSWR